MAKGDVVVGLKARREIEALLRDMKAYHTEGIEDGFGADETERKKASFRHEDFDVEHELGDPKDLLQRWCPQCFSLNAIRRIETLLQGLPK